MATLIDYKGLDVLDTATGAGGAAINDDFKKMADRAGPVRTDTSDPTPNDDSAGTAGNGKFYVWSKWLNSASGKIFVCTDAAPTAAVWVDITGGGGGGSIAQVQKATAIQNSAVASITASYGSPPTQNNLLLAVAISQRPFPAVATPAGWSLAVRIPFGTAGATLGGAMFYRVAGAAEPSNVTVANTSGTAPMGLAIFEYSGTLAVQASVLDVSAFNYGPDVNCFQVFTGTTPTTSQASTLALAALGGSGAVVSWNNQWSNGFVQEAALVGSSGTSVALTVAAKITSSPVALGTGESWTGATRVSGCIAVFKGG